MNRQAISARKALIEQWNEIISALSKLHSTAEVRPDQGESVFSIAEGAPEGVITFELRPVVFNLPERADDVSDDLYVVVAGRLSIDAHSVQRGQDLRTHDFSTKAAYFRKTKTALTHVYGAHYDFALNELGHPTFHMQLRSFAELAPAITEQYPGITGEAKDHMGDVLRNVRLPCAQMDFFSFMTQLCADHLLFKDSTKEERKAFNQLVTKNATLRGAGTRAPRLADDAAQRCYRAGHWYPLVA